MSDLTGEQIVTLSTIWWWQKLGETGSRQTSNTKIWCGESESQESKEQYQAKISYRFTALENLDDDVDIIWAWEGIRKNIKPSAKENRIETA
jgi:hypothetical protein